MNNINNRIKKNLTLNYFDFKNSNMKNNSNNNIKNYIYINNINIKKTPDNRNTYSTNLKNPNSPKLNIIKNNGINQTDINEIKEYRMKHLYTEENINQNISHKLSHYYNRNILYNSILNINHDLNEDTPNIKNNLIKNEQNNENQNKKKLSTEYNEKLNKRNYIILPINFKKKPVSFSKLNLYNSPFKKKSSFSNINSPKYNVY